MPSAVEHAERGAHTLFHEVLYFIGESAYDVIWFAGTAAVVGATLAGLLAVTVMLLRVCGVGEHTRRLVKYLGGIGAFTLTAWLALKAVGLSV